MSSICERGYIEFNPNLNNSYDKEHDEGIYVPSDYPFSVPKIYIEGSCETYYPQIAFDWSDDTVVVAREDFLIKYTKRCYCELLAEDENGNVIYDQHRIETSSFEIEISGKVIVKITGEDHKGSYSLSW